MRWSKIGLWAVAAPRPILLLSRRTGVPPVLADGLPACRFIGGQAGRTVCPPRLEACSPIKKRKTNSIVRPHLFRRAGLREQAGAMGADEARGGEHNDDARCAAICCYAIPVAPPNTAGRLESASRRTTSKAGKRSARWRGRSGSGPR